MVPFPFTLEQIPSGPWWERFTAPAGTQLNANTTYYVIAFTTLDSSSSDNNIFSLLRGSDDGEDSGSASGWSIANAYRFQRTSAPTASQAWGRTSTGNSLKIRVNGAALPTPAPSGLRVTPGDRKLTLRWQAPAPLEAGDSVYTFGYEAAYSCGGSWIDHGEKLTRSGGRFNDPNSRQTTRVMDGLVPGVAYDVRVRASIFWFRAGTTHNILTDWVYGTGTPSGAGGSTSCGTNARLRNLEMNTGN